MLGPSGSGKTTTLNLIAGFLDPDAGRIELDGSELSGIAPHKRGLGMVFQQYALFPHMTIRENVAYPLRVRRVGRDERRALEIGRASCRERVSMWEGLGAREQEEGIREG